MSAKLNLDKLLKPKSIAIVGASIRPESYGCMVLDMLQQHNYSGPIYPVNPRYTDMKGLACYPDLEAVPGPIDLAYIALPSAAVIDVLEVAGKVGVGGAVIPGSGFADGGAAGIALQRRLVETAARYGIAICGPNNMGYINYHERTASWPTFVPDIISPSSVALISQSGSVGIAISQDGRELQFGYLVGSGNEANVTAADYLDYFIRDDRINVVLCFLETIRDPQAFAAAAEEAKARAKRIAVVKVGRSDTSSRMVAAHTGAIAGEDKVYDAFFRRHAIARAYDLDELVELGALLSLQPSAPALATFAPVTLSGGEAALVADICSDLGLEIPDFEADTVDKLKAYFPAFATPRNPVDAYGLGWDPDYFERVVQAVAEDPGVGIVPLCMDTAAHGAGDHGMATVMADICARIMEKTRKQFVFINNTSGSGVSADARKALGAVGIPVLVGMRPALGAIAEWVRLTGAKASAVRESPESGWGEKAAAVRSEAGRLALLNEAGVHMVESHVVASAEEAVSLMPALGSMVMKGTAPALLHKTEHGLVRLGLDDAQSVREAYNALHAAVREAVGEHAEYQIIVQPMVADGIELILGAQHSEGFGTAIAVGLGGTLVEIIKQASLRLAPIDLSTAREMLEETPAATLLRGTRGRGPYDLDAACEAIVAFSKFAAQTHGQLQAIEINPLLVRPVGQGVCGLDAVFER